MSSCFRFFAVSFFVALSSIACSGGSESVDPADAPTAVPTVVEAQPEATVTPEPEAPSVSNADLVAAALAALEAKPHADQDLVAYDVLETEVSDDGLVTISICGWTGQSVFESVYEAMFRTTVQSDGSVTATHWQTPFGSGECLNTELIDSAFATINAYDDYWTDISGDPARFASDPRGQELLTSRYFANSETVASNWIEDRVSYRGVGFDGALRRVAVADLLFKRSQLDASGMFEVVVCTEMNQEHGLYRDDALLADEKPEDVGPHAIDAYVLELIGNSDVRWRVSTWEGLVWADCFAGESWPTAAKTWRQSDTSYEVLER